MSFQKTVRHLFCAIKLRDRKKAHEILSKDPKLVNHPGCKDNKSASVMWDAMLLGDEKIVELLIEEFGADPDEKSQITRVFYFGYTFLQYFACSRSSYRKFKVAEVLIQHGADVNAFHAVGTTVLVNTPLQIALQFRHFTIVEFLLKNGARLAGPEWDEAWKSPATYVIETYSDDSECKEFLLLLFSYGQDTKYRNIRDENLLNFFVRFRAHWENLMYPFQNKDTVGIAEVLLNSGVQLEDLVNREYSVLSLAIAGKRDVDLSTLFVERGANVNFSSSGLFPLLMSILFFDTVSDEKLANFVELLISKGAVIDAKNEYGYTALHAACRHNRERVISLLIQKGADVCAESDDGDTPFSLSINDENNACAIILMKEYSKMTFENLSVPAKVMDLIRKNSKFYAQFENCLDELKQMTLTKFHFPYSYYSVLKMSKQITKLANLTRNKKFVQEFENKLTFSYFKHDLRKNFHEAIQLRDERLNVEKKLIGVFRDFIPDVVIRKLAKDLTCEDLHLLQ